MDSQAQAASQSAVSAAEFGMSQGTIENTMEPHWKISDKSLEQSLIKY